MTERRRDGDDGIMTEGFGPPKLYVFDHTPDVHPIPLQSSGIFVETQILKRIPSAYKIPK